MWCQDGRATDGDGVDTYSGDDGQNGFVANATAAWSSIRSGRRGGVCF